jgi:hypothetical protein
VIGAETQPLWVEIAEFLRSSLPHALVLGALVAFASAAGPDVIDRHRVRLHRASARVVRWAAHWPAAT